MAVVATKKEDTKYSHLSKIYKNGDEKVVKKSKSKKIDSDDSKVKISAPEVKVTKQETIKLVILTVSIGLVSVVGYLISRFL